MAPDGNVRLYGTAEAVDTVRPVRLGPLSFLYSQNAVRRICWQGTELVRAVTWPIRDENWGTYRPEILQERHDVSNGAFCAELIFSVADGGLECQLAIRATAAGGVGFDLEMKPKHGRFATNRAGFTVLHPIRGVAGAPLVVEHAGGEMERTQFPRLISPGQPVLDIRRLTYDLGGNVTHIEFSGEVFEMEDQRNWSDASYKTYCVPLVHPFTYQISEITTQSLRISLAGNAGGAYEGDLGEGPAIRSTDRVAPAVGLAAEPGWMDAAWAVSASGAGYLLARLTQADPSDYLEHLALACEGRGLDLELVLDDAKEPAAALLELRDKVQSAGLSPRRIIAIPEGYLASHQPSGPWPEGPTPAEVIPAVREVFPNLAVGGGMLTNFTEFNRCPPDPALCDFITHGSTAIVHAGDDLSVCETLEALPQIFESAEALACGKPYRLGLVSIGMRSNPYGAAVADNTGQIRQTMAREDPRQRGLFAAAWAVGVLASTEGRAVEALCLAAPSGPFGIAYARQSVPQAYYDETAGAAVYPIFHVVKAAAAMAGHRRLSLNGLPAGVYAFGVEMMGDRRLMVANVTPDKVTFGLAEGGAAALLDETTFAEATTQADWLDRTARQDATRIELGGFAVAFIG